MRGASDPRTKQSSTQDSSVGLENAGPAGARASLARGFPAGFPSRLGACMQKWLALDIRQGLVAYNMNT